MKKPLAGSGEGSHPTTSVEPPKLALGGERRFRPCLPGLKGSNSRLEICQREGALPTPVLADRERLVGLLVPVDDDVRDLVELGVPDALPDGLVGVVDLDPMGREPGCELRCYGPVALAHREHAEMDRCEPERERAGVVLDQDSHEALERPEQRAMDDVREVLLVVAAHV